MNVWGKEVNSCDTCYLSRLFEDSTRNRIVFHKDSRKRIAEKLGITVQTVYTIMLSLREKGILGDDCFTKKYVLGNIDNIQFYFIDK